LLAAKRLAESFPDLIADGPKTATAAVRTGKLMSRVESHYREAFRQIFYSLIAANVQTILRGFGFPF
jgi:hypothetical protein